MLRHGCCGNVDSLSTLCKRLWCGGHDTVAVAIVVGGGGTWVALLQEALLACSLSESLGWKLVSNVEFGKDILDSNHKLCSSLESFAKILPVALVREPEGEDDLVDINNIRHTHVKTRSKITALAINPCSESFAQ